MLAALLILALTPQQQLDHAKVRWQKLHARNYAYVVTKSCGRCMPEPATIRVHAGKPSGTPAGYASLDTVPELFRRIQTAIDGHAHAIDVRYGPRSGVPTMVSIDESAGVADDVTGFVVQRFHRT